MSHAAIRMRLAVVMVAAGMLAQACAPSGLSFVQDDRLDFEAPSANETVSLPFEVRWTIEDYDGSFAVFFDRSPIRPNQPLRSVVPDGDPCLARPTCPDAAWLAEQDVYVTAGTVVVIEDLPDRRDNSRQQDRHDLAIVFVDEEGKRIGESVFTREFIVERDA